MNCLIKSMINPKDDNLSMVCKTCNTEFTLRDGVTNRQVGQITQVGIECPKCKVFKHSYIETNELRSCRDKLKKALQAYSIASSKEKRLRFDQLKTAQEVYKRLFEDTQKQWIKKRKIPIN